MHCHNLLGSGALHAIVCWRHIICREALISRVDYLSNSHNQNIDWKLHPTVFLWVSQTLFVPDIDLFASRLNFETKSYISWFPDADALGVDAFWLYWKILNFVCPSFSLLGRVPRKLKLGEVSDALIIAPCLPTAHWYPQLPELLVQRPALVPQWETLLPLPQEDVLHPLREMIRLTAWHFTEIAWRSEEFLRGQPIMCSSLGDPKQYSTVWKVFLLLVWEETEKSASDRSGDNLWLFYCTVWKFQQDAVGAYIWAWLCYAYDTFNMPYCS